MPEGQGNQERWTSSCFTKQPPQSGSHFSRGAKVLFKIWFLPFLPLPSLGRKSPNHPSPVMASSGPCHPISQLRAKVHFSKWKPNYTNPLIKFIQWLPTALEIEVRNQILQCPSSLVTFHRASLSLLLRAFSKFIEHTHYSSCTEPSPGHPSLSLSFLSSSPSQLLVLLGSVLTSLMDKLSLTSVNRSFIIGSLGTLCFSFLALTTAVVLRFFCGILSLLFLSSTQVPIFRNLKN